MAQEKGNISIHAQNIMPIIKKWLYSDKDIFLREIVSNGCDAIAKYKMLVLSGQAPEDEGGYRVDVVADEQQGCLKVTDNGLGMTADEVRKFIAQVAFSGAEEFLKQYKQGEEGGGIIGHFGLGFYSAFMVSKRVTIDTLSWQQGAEPVSWSSEDGLEYELGTSDRSQRGTTITMYLNEDDQEFLHLHTLRATLEKYCAFMPTPIYLSEVKPPEEPKEGEEAKEGEEPKKPEEPQQVNDPEPLWLKRPSEVTDEGYLEFYRKVFHEYEPPLFWIHLNAEYPFNLKGILYFPKIKNEFTSSEGQIKLYSGQVFVADNIKEVIPEFLMLLKGVIDCPDLPLNVSRSFLQNDGYVKKVSAYITRKVADRLMSEFNTKRQDYQKYWDDIHPFIKYGCIRDEKFYERVKDALLFKTVDGEYLTIKEYKDKNCDEQNKTVFYASDAQRQAQMIDIYKQQDKDVVLLDTMIDSNFISFLEYTEKGDLQFKRVDAGLDGLTEQGEADEEARAALEKKFRAALGQEDLEVKLETLKSDELPAMVTVEEQSRRFSEMSRNWGGGYGMPEKRTLVLNAKHPLIKYLETCEESGETAEMICSQVVDLAEMSRQPLEAERMVKFLKRSNQLLSMMAQNMK